jgi:uncharacterized protein
MSRGLLILFAHGAGVPSSSPWMLAWAERMGELGRVVPFDYPYAREGRRAPDRFPKLLEAHRQALAEARADHEGPVVLAGKSMGSRIGCHLAVEEKVNGVICFGYPLVSPGRTAQQRDQVLRELQTPVLFLQGTRDRLCPLELLEPIRREMDALSFLHVVEGGDHSLNLSKKAMREQDITQADADDRIYVAIRDFLIDALD